MTSDKKDRRIRLDKVKKAWEKKLKIHKILIHGKLPFELQSFDDIRIYFYH